MTWGSLHRLYRLAHQKGKKANFLHKKFFLNFKQNDKKKWGAEYKED